MNYCRICTAFLCLVLFLVHGCSSWKSHPSPQEEFANPTEFKSENGVLRGKFVLEPTTLEFNGRKVRTNTYNGLYCPPTLRVSPGDTIELEFVNNCPQPSNIHFHGMVVPPLYNGDNIFVRVDPGHTFNYKFTVPKDHTPGLYYYHAHSHGFSERQITFGFSGALVVDGQLNAYPDLKEVKEQIMVLKDIQISPFGDVSQDIVTSRTAIRTVNGQINPIIHAKPGESQFWRIANTGANLYYRLSLGGQTFYVVAEDANPTLKMLPVTEYLLGPSARVEVMVQFPAEGKYNLKTEQVRTGPAGDGYPATELVTVDVKGDAVTPISLPIAKDCCINPVQDLRTLPINEKRLIVFNETDTDFRVNNRIFDENRIDTRVPLGNVEEWTIRNATDELHQFHIHQTDFQITEINGKPVEFTGHRDNFVIPIRGEVKFIIPFTNPVIVGNFVYHCHIIEHEDGGMMATIQVYDPKNPDAVPAPWEHIVTPPADVQAKGGPIHLTDQQGDAWTGENTKAELLLVSFGYTHCKGVCPRTQGIINETMKQLSSLAGQVQPVLVTIDPQRDTPARMQKYTEDTGTNLVGLTGTDAEIAIVAREFGVSYQKLPTQPDGSYGMSHSSDLFLTTRDGQIIERFELITPAAEIAQRARQALMQASAGRIP
jgi:FtsP/CotA-like multicopper oxidase with cupredoxin domain/cytochrome oxidase Cu insertion factor (SCO1/SenC/PrrC family)